MENPAHSSFGDWLERHPNYFPKSVTVVVFHLVEELLDILLSKNCWSSRRLFRNNGAFLFSFFNNGENCADAETMCLGNAGGGCTGLIGSNDTAFELDRKILGHGVILVEYNGGGMGVLRVEIFFFLSEKSEDAVGGFFLERQSFNPKTEV